MSLKSIKKNYTTLLKAFSEAGVKLNESQKASLDNFVMDLEETTTDILEEKDKKDKTSDNTTNNNSEKDAEGSVSTQDSTSDNEVNENGESNEDEPTSVPITESQMVSWIDAFNRFTSNK